MIMAKDDSIFPDRFKNTRFKNWIVDNDNVIDESLSITGLNDSIDVDIDTKGIEYSANTAVKAQDNAKTPSVNVSKTIGGKRGPKESRIMDGTREQRTTAIKIMVKPDFSKKCRAFCNEKDMTIEELGYLAISEHIKRK